MTELELMELRLNDVEDKKLIKIWNLYCEINSDMPSMINLLTEEEINNIYKDKTPFEIIREQERDSVDIDNDYYNYDGYGNVNTFDSIDEVAEISDIMTLAEEDDNYFNEILEILENNY